MFFVNTLDHSPSAPHSSPVWLIDDENVVSACWSWQSLCVCCIMQPEISVKMVEHVITGMFL